MSDLSIYPLPIGYSRRGYKRNKPDKTFEKHLDDMQESQEPETKTSSQASRPFLIRPSNIAVLIEAAS